MGCSDESPTTSRVAMVETAVRHHKEQLENDIIEDCCNLSQRL